MRAWEYELFRKGAGCPCCEGETPKGLDPEEAEITHLRSVVFGGTDDPDQFERLHAVNRDRPKWVEPEPEKLWTCHGCGVSVVRSLDAPLDGAQTSQDDDWLEWYGGEKVHYQGSNFAYAYSSIYNAEDPSEEPYHELGGEHYCPGCVTRCAECGDPIFARSDLEGGDVYDEGSSFPHPGNPFWGSLCLACYEEESRCDTCGHDLDDCQCCDDCNSYPCECSEDDED
jgi:hypothetical protein